MTATLTISPLPGGEPGDKAVTLDCRHATTTAYLVAPPGQQLPDAVLVRMVLDQHLREEPDCACCGELIRRYGLTPQPVVTR